MKTSNTLKVKGIIYALILITILIVGSNVYAECNGCENSGTIKFYVYDSSGNPIEDAITHVEGRNSLTDSSGNTLMSANILEGETCAWVNYLVFKEGYTKIGGSVFICDIGVSRADIVIKKDLSQTITMLSFIKSMATTTQADCTGTKYCCSLKPGSSEIHKLQYIWHTDNGGWCEYKQTIYEDCGSKTYYACECTGGSSSCGGSGADSCECIPVGPDDCTPRWTGSKWCYGNNVWQKYQEVDCSTPEKVKLVCTSGYTCKNGACVEDAPAQYCGDGTCGSGESCSNCPPDCGSCVFCCNGKCDTGETCGTCPLDCGTCDPPNTCGNNVCDGSDTCANCPGDCGTCAICGDGVCTEGYETTTTSPADCKVNPDEGIPWWEVKYYGTELWMILVGAVIIIILIFWLFSGSQKTK